MWGDFCEIYAPIAEKDDDSMKELENKDLNINNTNEEK